MPIINLMLERESSQDAGGRGWKPLEGIKQRGSAAGVEIDAR